MNGHIGSRLAVLVFVVLPVLACLTACSGSSSASPSTPTVSSPYSGNWTGTIDSRRSIAFTVADNQVTALTLNDQTLAIAPPFNPFLCRMALTLAAAVPINGTSFTAPVRGTFGATTIQATFASTTTASGQFNAYTTFAGNCPDAAGVVGTVAAGQSLLAGTWQATKQ